MVALRGTPSLSVSYLVFARATSRKPGPLKRAFHFGHMISHMIFLSSLIKSPLRSPLALGPSFIITLWVTLRLSALPSGSLFQQTSYGHLCASQYLIYRSIYRSIYRYSHFPDELLIVLRGDNISSSYWDLTLLTSYCRYVSIIWIIFKFSQMIMWYWSVIGANLLQVSFCMCYLSLQSCKTSLLVSQLFLWH